MSEARPDAVFHLDGDRAVPTGFARGPWSPHAMHGGAPAALIARAVERHDPGPASFVARLTIELLRPVPLVPLEVGARTVRPGKKVQWIEVSLTADGTEVVRATALRLRTDPALALQVPEPAPLAMPGPARSEPIVLDLGEAGWGERSEIGFAKVFELRAAHGSFGVPGPAGLWFRLAVPLVAGEEPSALQRVAAAADFGNGVSALFGDGRHSFINADLTVSLWRLPAGEWVGIDSVSHASPDGVGVAESVLVDEQGRLGRALQSLLVDRS
jgi:hypothetical protein